ncbi:uncharacterized protein FOBCDRAFT_138768 [Fusarium oxysporum Fo47]|uniref:uncharacterized protein n=1 Tax=Fusarium oxysporum Fo47 TaxID=660027 RepID=UPI0028699BE6|nr:uncharacterized protein FOBCDRAFT_138768 [Fusarium oxysporum Fo47]WJG35705.1 hypothetical protein FOBCDRAFT_138768 [Fusarium oxysporum Fo47]
MCQKTARKGLCGHLLAPASWSPSDPENCRLARRANRRNDRSGKLLRCSPPMSTTVVQDDTQVCSPDCFVDYILIGRGWVCCRCNYANPVGSHQCDGSVPNNEYPYYAESCCHYPCAERCLSGSGQSRRRRR